MVSQIGFSSGGLICRVRGSQVRNRALSAGNTSTWLGSQKSGGVGARVAGLRARLVWERAARGAFAACAVERRARTWVSGWDQGFGCWEFVVNCRHGLGDKKSGGVSARVGGLRARLVWEGAARGALAACAAERRALCAAGQRGGGVGAHARRINTACPRGDSHRKDASHRDTYGMQETPTRRDLPSAYVSRYTFRYMPVSSA